MADLDGARNARGLLGVLKRQGVTLGMIVGLAATSIGLSAGPASAQEVDRSNVATAGTASQSSTFSGPDRGAELAIDGNTAGRRSDRSTTHTRREQNPWWQVELDETVDVGEVTIWNRTDCCLNRLSNFWVFVSAQPFASNDLNTLINDPNVTAQHVTTKPAPSISLDFGGMPGRYVRVQIEGTQFLSLAEVQVSEGDTRTYPYATQSSTYPGPDRGAELAIDGNTAGRRSDRSTTHTLKEKDPWWQVELAESTEVRDVTIWNRTDGSAGRLSNFWVMTSNEPFASNDLNTLINDPKVTAQHVTIRPSPSTTLNFPATAARFVRVQIQGTQFLSLAEVEINTAQPPAEFPHATQSSTGYGGDAARALDGNVDGNYFNGSVTHTAPGDTNPWLNIELSGERDLRAVEIWHRTDARIDRNDILVVKASATNSNACTADADYETIMRRNGKRAYKVSIGGKFGLGSGNQAFPIKSICIATNNNQPLSIAETIFHYGTTWSEADDTFTAYADEMLSGWIGPSYGLGGNDTYSMWANRYGDATFRDALEKGYITTITNQGYQLYQRHNYGGPGDDVFNMGFPVHVDGDTVRMGHHVYGWDGNDTFNFVDIENVRSDIWVFGRIDDFQIGEDTIQIDGQDLDFNNLPDNVRLVNYTPPNAANLPHAQQWLLITNAQGGHIFYALEGARYNGESPDRVWVEKHFIREAPNIATDLTDTSFEDTVPYVPIDERRGLTPYPSHYGSEVGTDADELFQGSRGTGTGYDQHVFAGAGNDLVGLGPSDDTLFGEQGDDKLWAGTDDDNVDGGSGDDYVDGGIGSDTLRGGPGNDELVGGQGDDLISGDAGSGTTYWVFQSVVKNRYVRKTGLEEESLTNGKPLVINRPSMLTVEDDDGSLESADSAEQSVYHHTLGTRRDSKVNLKGVIPVKNETTGATANAYQIELVHRGHGDVGDLPTATAWAFDTPGFGSQNNKIVPNGEFRAIDNVAFDQLAFAADSGDSSGGQDVFVFDDNAGDDTVVDFEVGIDKLRLPLSAQGNVTVTDLAGATVVSFANTTITLTGVALADFSQDDIVFV